MFRINTIGRICSQTVLHGRGRCRYLSTRTSETLTLPDGTIYDQPTGLFIDGEFVASVDNTMCEVINPATEERITTIYEGSTRDVDIAVEAAKKAFDGDNDKHPVGWSRVEPEQRARALFKLADLIERDQKLLSAIEAADNGKSLYCAKSDVALVSRYLRTCGGWADKLYGRVIDTGKDHFTYSIREPLGVCGQIIPWNFPLLMWSWKIGPALATGNTMVLKPAENTALSALYGAKLCQEAGVPAGVVNIVPGAGRIVGERLCQHPDVKKIAFTGSTKTGSHIMKSAADSIKKVTLELGGKSPNIVFSDANLDLAIESIAHGIFFNAGEVCCAGSRVYVQDSVYDEVLRRFKEYTESLKIGDPFEKDVYQGAQTSEQQMNTILRYIDAGKKEGARVVTGGQRLNRSGFFIKPTIFADVDENMTIVKEEIFGPVVTVSKFSTVSEVVSKANDSQYGLAAGIHTRDVNKAIEVARRIKAGTVWVNTYNSLHQNVPFGGFGQSGIGREMGESALDNYTQVKSVRMAIEHPQI